MTLRVSKNQGSHTWYTAEHERKLRRHARGASGFAPVYTQFRITDIGDDVMIFSGQVCNDPFFELREDKVRSRTALAQTQNWKTEFEGTFSDIEGTIMRLGDSAGNPVLPTYVMDWRTGPCTLSGNDHLPFVTLSITDGTHVTAVSNGDGTYSPRMTLAGWYAFGIWATP